MKNDLSALKNDILEKLFTCKDKDEFSQLIKRSPLKKMSDKTIADLYEKVQTASKSLSLEELTNVVGSGYWIWEGGPYTVWYGTIEEIPEQYRDQVRK